jgi:Fe-S oxidoreductase
VHCGFCYATRPTCQLLGDELDGPRGRTYLMNQVLGLNDIRRNIDVWWPLGRARHHRYGSCCRPAPTDEAFAKLPACTATVFACTFAVPGVVAAARANRFVAKG